MEQHADRQENKPGGEESPANSKVTTDEKTKAEKALTVALDIRKFEIDLYWKRAAYFWAFLALILGSYFGVLTSTAKELECHPVLKAEALLIISCLGIVFSMAWYFVNRGSKLWQENWEKHVDLLEDAVHGPLYKTVLSNDSPRFWSMMQSYPFSVSKINQILSLVTICAFILLAFMTFLTALLHSIGWWPTLPASKYWVIPAMIVTGVVAYIVVRILYRCGQSKLGEKEPTLLNITKYKADFALIKTPTDTETETDTKPETNTKPETDIKVETHTETETKAEIWVWNRN